MNDDEAFSSHPSDEQLAAYALGQPDAELALHVEQCADCRSQVDFCRDILQNTQSLFGRPAIPVDLVPCPDELITTASHCEVTDHTQGLRIALSVQSGWLFGRLSAEDDDCTCWQDAPVRLFGAQGLIAASRVSWDGTFCLPMPEKGQRFSLGLVLPCDQQAELKIIGQFDLMSQPV